MGDLGDSYREHRAHQRIVKRHRGDKNMRQLRRLEAEDPDVTVTIVGDAYVVRYQDRRATFWPTTGSTILQFGRDRSTKYFTGNQLIAFLKTGKC